MPPKKNQQNEDEMEAIRKSLSVMSEEISKVAKQLTHFAPTRASFPDNDGSVLVRPFGLGQQHPDLPHQPPQKVD